MDVLLFRTRRSGEKWLPLSRLAARAAR